jgi:uncharacterized protein (DUF488 family)
VIYTIGHSTRAIDEFVGLLRAHGIQQLADVRTVPKSRRHPHFAKEALAASLARADVAYRHVPALGGLRRPRPDSTNTAWRHAGFRGYADYMETPPFDEALDDLIRWSSEGRTTVMCAEAVWWQCHRRLIADALVARTIEVRHILGPEVPKPHELTPFARLEAGRVRYPGLI